MNVVGNVETSLRQSVLFSSLSDDELDALGRLASLVQVDSEGILFGEGEPGTCLFVVLSGTVRLSTLDAHGRIQPTALIGEGQAFGEMAALDGEPRSATATATCDSTLARIDKKDLDLLAAEYPESEAKILREGMRLVAARLRKSNSRFWELARNALTQKRRLANTRASFLSLVSHELRTPLAIIKSSAQLMLRSAKADHEDFLGKIVTESNRLAMLVDDVITFSLLQSDTGLQDWSEFDGVPLSQRVMRGLRGVAEEREVRVSLSASIDPFRVLGDPILIARALHHLLDNAIKFSRPSSDVAISLDRDGDRCVRLSVSDNGIGFDASRLSNLLQSFIQAESPLNREVEGMGIGLALVDEVVRAHGGSLLVDSEPGRGSRFTIVLPYDRKLDDTSEEIVETNWREI